MRVLVTGQTPFKGTWLSMWLAGQGHEVIGYALDPEAGSVLERADVSSLLLAGERG